MSFQTILENMSEEVLALVVNFGYNGNSIYFENSQVENTAPMTVREVLEKLTELENTIACSYFRLINKDGKNITPMGIHKNDIDFVFFQKAFDEKLIIEFYSVDM